MVLISQDVIFCGKLAAQNFAAVILATISFCLAICGNKLANYVPYMMKITDTELKFSNYAMS